jgi:aldehyde dehydrogenase (NAD+)
LTNPTKQPTLLGGEWVGSESDEWLEEMVFGPVLAISISNDMDEAVAAVNDSPYGLSAAVFTNDMQVAMRFAREVDTGQVAINGPTSGWDVHLPFGGFKESGSMSKEQGTEGLGFYTRVKTVAIGYTE